MDELNRLKETMCGEVDRKLEQDSRRESLQNTILGFSMELVPNIVNAVKAGVFDAASVENMCKNLEKIDPKPPFLDKIIMQFRRISYGNDGENFRNIVLEYLSQIENTPTLEEKKAIEKKLNSFVFNIFVPPCQRDNEESCFATSSLIKIWHDFPGQYMNLIKGVIDDDLVNLGILQEKSGELIDVKSFGNGLKTNNDYDRVYQKLVSAFALLEKRRIKTLGENFSNNILKRCTELGLKIFAKEISDNLLKEGLIWDQKWKLPLCMSQDVLNVKKKTIDSIKAKILKIIEKIVTNTIDQTLKSGHIDADSLPLVSLEGIRTLAKGVAEAVIGGGSYGDDIIYAVADSVNGVRASVIKFAQPLENGIFSISEFQPILDILSSYQEGQFIRVDWHTDDEKGHGCNFIAKKYDLDRISDGKEEIIGDSNYVDKLDQNCSIYIKKLDDDRVQLTLGGSESLTGTDRIKSISVYENFGTKLSEEKILTEMFQIIQDGMELKTSDEDQAKIHQYNEWHRYASELRDSIDFLQEQRANPGTNVADIDLQIQGQQKKLDEAINHIHYTYNDTEYKRIEIEAIRESSTKDDPTAKIAIRLIPSMIKAFEAGYLNKTLFENLHKKMIETNPNPESLDIINNFKRMVDEEYFRNIFCEDVEYCLGEVRNNTGNEKALDDLIAVLSNDMAGYAVA